MAVKLFQVFGRPYFTARDYLESKSTRSAIEASREECKTIQAIHEGDTLDPIDSRHVTRCLYDGISPELQKPKEEMLQASMPLYLVLDFMGTDNVEKWWGKLLGNCDAAQA